MEFCLVVFLSDGTAIEFLQTGYRLFPLSSALNERSLAVVHELMKARRRILALSVSSAHNLLVQAL